MKLKKRPFPIPLNTFIALALIVAALFSWVNVLQSQAPPHTVAAIRDPEVAALLDYIHSGEHSGETWEVTLSELEAEQTITWYLQKYPQIPFSHPQVEITPAYVAGEGDAVIAGLRVHVGGKARITLKDGLPVVEILALSIPVPASIRQALEDEVQRQLKRADLLPVRFTSAEWQEGVVVVRGIIR